MIACCVALIIGQVYLDLRIPEYMSEITYRLQTGEGTGEIAECGIRMMACAFASLGLAICTSVLSARAASSLCRTLREKQFRKIATWSRQDLDSFSVASLITRSTNDVYQLQQFIGRAISMVVKAPVLAIWALMKITTSAFEWTAVTGAAMAILLIAISLIMWRGTPYIRRMQWFVDAVNSETREELEGMRTIRAYNAETKTEMDFDKSSDDLCDNSVKAVRIMSLMHPLASSMMSFLTMAIYWVGAGAIEAASGDADAQMRLFSDMIVFTSYATMVLSSVMMATGILRMMPNIIVSSKRIEEVITHDSSIRDGSLYADDALQPGAVDFDRVSFAYPGSGKEVLHDVSFHASAGSTLAIIGPTASGKSTIISLIARLYDTTEGSVSVGGKDVREYREEDLDSMIGYVPQTAVVFTGSLKDNVGYGWKARSDDMIERAIRIAQLSELVERMPEGMDSDVSQHGWNLSGGQKQRLSIARAVCKNPPIYLFDDSFSALDSRTDRNLREALRKETAGATKIIVAQRVGTIMDADLILVLDEGRVVGSGTHEELMESCPLYREIAQSQLEDFDDRGRERRQSSPEGAVVDARQRQAEGPWQGDARAPWLHGP